ncbi:hypothetical protein KPL71_023319 [Citrus sinensis]|uniref:Uncharacterized protein n=1 Tax=Citrus sinensis TaxID=2711 RepID=A0ACB8IIM0_CITSI|nr:hypothetical protein KPL71_023319 [Citrus sinensis]
MNPLYCRTSSFSSSSSGKTSDSKHVVSSEEFVIENFDKAIDCWELPKISKEQIYKTKKLDFFKSDYVIKTEERDITLSSPFETIHLFSEKSLKKLKEKNFNYIHIGLIQIGIKPLTKEGLDTSILAVLRDGRFISFDDSLLSSIESSLYKGPISFDCYPNITLSLKDKNILKSMILQIKTHNYNMIEGSVPVALIFKISYKAMISAFSTQHKFQSKRDETLLLQTDLSKANTVIPKPIQWKDVNLPEEWILEGVAPPAVPKQLEPNTELQNVTQYSDGKVKLSFRRSNSSRFSDKESCSSIPSLERKFTKIPSVINLPFQSQPRFSTSDVPSSSIRSVDYTTKVPHPIYISSQHEQRQEEKEPSPPTSPTFSAVTENVLNVIEKQFDLDKTLLHNDFYSENNKEKRLWFFEHFLKQRKEIQQTYYEFVNLHQVHILFFDWFEIYSSENNISYPFKESNPITIRKKTTEWKLHDSSRIVESEHPPLRSITVDHGEPPIQIRASPYKIPKINDTDSNLSSIIQQNNFCNTNLNTIGKQLTRIENQFQQSTISISPSPKPVSSKSDYDKKLKEPIFKPFQVSKTSQKLVHESKSDFAKAIREQLDRIEAASSSSNRVNIAPDTPQSSKIGVLEQDQVSIASSDLEAFTETPIPKANKIHWELALPTSKSAPDLTIDNRPSALNQARYNASSVYEWNIDGMSEYNILGVLQQMTMAANAYKTQSGTSDKAIAEILIAGFTGQLKGWWDHLLTKLQQLDILNAIQIDENGSPILDEINNPIQDAVATLILTISLHFIGDPSHLRDKNAELLHNLRCRKLSDFQDYKTTFFTRLFLRDDANHVTWKEKFLAGLPTLLGEKVRNSIKTLFDNRIPYDELTYGELVSFVNKEGLKICQDLKLQKRLKQELRQSKQELGGFCKQFNYDPFKASTSKDCNGKCSSKPYRKHYKHKSHRKPFHDFRKLPYKKPSRPYKKHGFSKKKEFKANPKTPFNFKDATCFKCGMKGHTAKFCRMNKRLHELDLNEDILSKIAPLLVESSDSESSMSGENDPLQVDELFSDSSASSSSDSDSDSYLKKINVLTKDQEIFLELVKHISDPVLQKEYLDKLLKTMDSNKAGTSNVPIVKKNSYDLTEILDKKKTKKSTSSIQDLQKEIKDIKLEIKDLKEKQQSDSITIQLLLQKQLQDNSDNESTPDDGDNIDQKVENIKSVPQDFLFVLKQITTRKYLVKITLIFSKDFAIDAIALFDTGADLNCIREDIVPKRFHERTNERLSAANNSKLKVNSKVEASIYNEEIEFKTSFVLTNDIHHAIILGTPFINLITPYAVNYDDKFPDKILDKTQLQRFLGSLNYVIDFCPNINRMSKPLHDRLKKNPVAWSDEHTKVIMPPKKDKGKGKAVLKASGFQEPSKEPISTPSEEKLLSSALPIKSWIELVEEHEAQYKSTSSDDQVKQWMSSITRSPELMIALQNLSQSQSSLQEEKENPKDISKPSSQNVVVSCESSSSQIVLSQPTLSKKTSDWIDKNHFQNILSIEDGFYNSDPFQSISKFFPKGWFFKPWDLTKPQSYYQSILEITESVKFKHFFLSSSHSEPAYSTATILKDSQVILQRTFKVKWWSKFDEQSKLTTSEIEKWLSSRGHLQPTIKDTKAQQTFLTQKSKAQSLLASAKTEEEYFKAMEQLLASRSKSSVADSTEDEDDDVDEPTVSLGDENEDDCFGIFSPVKHCK